MELSHETEYDDGVVVAERLDFVGDLDEYLALLQTASNDTIRRMHAKVESIALATIDNE